MILRSPIGGDAAGTVQLVFELNESSRGMGAMFFGPRLIPMGYAIVTSDQMPRWLGRILVVGGAGYLLSAFVGIRVAEVRRGWSTDSPTSPPFVSSG